MSSFLMNSGSYVDPKFPTSEEYSQSSYIPHSEYYNQHIQAAQHYGYGVNASHYPTARDPMGYGGYYQQCSAMSPHQQENILFKNIFFKIQFGGRKDSFLFLFYILFSIDGFADFCTFDSFSRSCSLFLFLLSFPFSWYIFPVPFTFFMFLLPFPCSFHLFMFLFSFSCSWNLFPVPFTFSMFILPFPCSFYLFTVSFTFFMFLVPFSRSCYGFRTILLSEGIFPCLLLFSVLVYTFINNLNFPVPVIPATFSPLSSFYRFSYLFPFLLSFPFLLPFFIIFAFPFLLPFSTPATFSRLSSFSRSI